MAELRSAGRADGSPAGLQLRELDLRGNPISRTGARELLGFVAQAPALVQLHLEGTAIDHAMLGKIAQKLLRQREDVPSSVVAPADQ